MSNWIIVLTMIFIGLGATQLQTISAARNESTPGNEGGVEEDGEFFPEIKLTIAWIEKPPYATQPTNGSFDDEVQGMVRDVLARFIILECGLLAKINYQVKTFRADSEFHMIELLRQNKVHVGLPIFESKNQRYDEFSFLKITDYPGSEFITNEDETNTLSLVLDAVLKSWSLFAVTLILTAIAGIIMWALVCLILPNEITVGISKNANAFKDLQ